MYKFFIKKSNSINKVKFTEESRVITLIFMIVLVKTTMLYIVKVLLFWFLWQFGLSQFSFLRVLVFCRNHTKKKIVFNGSRKGFKSIRDFYYRYGSIKNKVIFYF